jgi:hypothetical protein
MGFAALEERPRVRGSESHGLIEVLDGQREELVVFRTGDALSPPDDASIPRRPVADANLVSA